jgi:hypothetical protein
MTQDHLADDFNGHTRAGCECGCMPSQVMGSEMNADHLTGFEHHHPGSFIGNWENPI